MKFLAKDAGFDICYLYGIFENPKFVDIIFISAKIELISGVFELARNRNV